MRKNNRLPNLHNLGIHLRILVIVNLLAILAAILQTKDLTDFLPRLAELSAVTQPILILSLLVLYGLYPLLDKLPYKISLCIVLLLEVSIAALMISFFSNFLWLGTESGPEYISYRAVILTGTVTAIVLYYFFLQQRAYSPAIAEARLQALQARIRPHFLFNSINAVLSLIRSQPKRAESALEDLADLFRVLMAENRDLVPLSQEIALCKQYLNIESLRLEERLKISWEIENSSEEAMIPPLILQPLIENAVYHGIEPLPEGGEILAVIKVKRKELHIYISNPFQAANGQHSGNKMALKNIKERLQLHFDLEARLKTYSKNQRFFVHIRMPYQTN